MKDGETKQTADGAMKVGRTLRDGFVELATNGGIPRRFGVHAEVLDLIESLAGDHLKGVPPPDPDEIAAEKMVWWHVYGGTPSVSFAYDDDAFRLSVNRESEAVLVFKIRAILAAALAAASRKGHAAGVAEERAKGQHQFGQGLKAGRAQAIGCLESPFHQSENPCHVAEMRVAAGILREWANGAK